MYYVYILYCPKTERSYVGQTNHLLNRMLQHRSGDCPYTRRLKDPQLIYWEQAPSRSQAMKRERFFKHGCGARIKKEIVAEFLDYS